MRGRYKILLLLFLLIAGAIFAGSQFEPVKAAARKVVYNLRFDDGLVGYWSFNGADMSGVTATDRGSGGNNGTLTGGPAVVPGAVGQGLKFNGSSNFVAIGAPPLTATDNWSMEAWINPANLNQLGFAVQNGIDSSSCGTDRGYGFGVGSGGGSAGSKLTGVATCVAFADSGYTFPAANRWYHVVMQRDNGTIKFFVDGAQTPSTSAAVPGTPITSARIGSQNGQQYFNGSVDEVRFYNRVLTPSEILYHYNKTSPAGAGGSGTVAKSVANKNGLVGYWDFDDCDTCTTVTDRSGNGNTGTMYNDGAGGQLNLHTASSSNSGFTGRIGSGALFDGSDDYVDITAPPMTATNNWTMAAWMNPANLNQLGFALQNGIDAGSCGTDRGYGFGVGNGSGSAGSKLQGVVTCVAWVDSGYTFPSANRWYHVVMQRDSGTIKFFVDGVQTSGTSASVPGTPITNARIGSQTGQRFFHGSVDDARMYNRVLSITEIKNLYNSTRKMFVNMPQNNLLTDGLVGYWSFNGPDMSGVTAIDRSGSGNNGTLTGGPTAIPGMVGQALNFDGSNDYVDIVDADDTKYLGALTICEWANVRTSGSNRHFAGKHLTNGASNNPFDFRTEDDRTMMFIRANAAGFRAWAGSKLTLNVWAHYCVTVADGTITTAPTFYIDGAPTTGTDAAGAGTGSATGAGANIRIGSRADEVAKMDGFIDEVRIYNRALSAAEVLKLYNAGKR